MPRMEGDWDCPDCGMVVFASKSACPRCEPGSGKGKGRREGDWDCPKCGALVFASKETCFKCDGGGGGGGGAGQWKGGDWECPNCGNHCFASKASCFKCGTKKDGTAAKVSARDGSASAPAAGSSVAPGDAIKALAKLSPSFKKSWIAYCKWCELGFTDPAKCDDEFLVEFADYVAGVLDEKISAEAPANGGAAKRSAAAAPAAEPAAKAKKMTMKKAVADEIRRINAEGEMLGTIRAAAVAASLSQLDEAAALGVLEELVSEKDSVEDPNVFINEKAQEACG